MTIEKSKHTDTHTQYSKIATLKTFKSAMYSLALLSEHEDNMQLSCALNALAKEFNIKNQLSHWTRKQLVCKCYVHIERPKTTF